MDFEVTELGTYARCSRKWDYSSQNRQNLQRIVNASALTLGTLMHSSLDHWYAHPESDLAWAFGELADREFERVQDAQHEHTGLDLTESQIDSFRDMRTLGLAMCKNYQTYYKTPLPRGFELLSTEQVVRLPIPGTEHHLTGRIDKIMRSPTGKVFIIDHKTYARRPTDIELDTSAQFLDYMLILKMLYPDVDTVGVAYDGIYKRATPVKGKSIDDLFLRRFLFRPHEELEERLWHIVQIVTEMTSDPIIYPHRHWTCNTECTFRELCLTQSRGEDVEYMRRFYAERPHYTAVDLSTGEDTPTEALASVG